jgi:hypothetical protein
METFGQLNVLGRETGTIMRQETGTIMRRETSTIMREETGTIGRLLIAPASWPRAGFDRQVSQCFAQIAGIARPSAESKQL